MKKQPGCFKNKKNLRYKYSLLASSFVVFYKARCCGRGGYPI